MSEQPMESEGEPRPEQSDVTYEDVARRAYEISQGEGAGSPEENWARAERELRGEQER